MDVRKMVFIRIFILCSLVIWLQYINQPLEIHWTVWSYLKKKFTPLIQDELTSWKFISKT